MCIRDSRPNNPEDPGAGEDAPPRSIDEQVTKSVLAELELLHIEKVLSDPAAVAKVLQGIKTPN